MTKEIKPLVMDAEQLYNMLHDQLTEQGLLIGSRADEALAEFCRIVTEED